MLMMRATILRNDCRTVETPGILFAPHRFEITYRGFFLPPDVAGYRRRVPLARSDEPPLRPHSSESSMKCLLFIASVAHLLLLSQLGDVHAAGAYDGEWKGSATVSIGQCKPAIVTLTVLGKVVIGQATFELGTRNINGTVSENGESGATIGWQHLTGKFIQDMFEGTFNSFDCTWKMALKRTK